MQSTILKEPVTGNLSSTTKKFKKFMNLTYLKEILKILWIFFGSIEDTDKLELCSHVEAEIVEGIEFESKL